MEVGPSPVWVRDFWPPHRPVLKVDGLRPLRRATTRLDRRRVRSRIARAAGVTLVALAGELGRGTTRSKP
jgi:hypothetical protein